MSTCSIVTSSPNENQVNLIAKKCIQRDIDKIKTNKENSSIIFVETIDGDILHLQATILGPILTPYANGLFLLEINLSEQYPVRLEEKNKQISIILLLF
jgi:ubiquitin-protein ligase